MAQVHDKRGAYVCETCGVDFPTQQGLSLHNTRAHIKNDDPKYNQDGEKSYSCNECDKVYHSSIGLYQHKSTIHKGRTYTCPICSKVYINASGYRLHMRKHGLTRQFPCEICGR